MHSKTPTSAGGFRRYLTTAIPYVNAAPHVGFALEMVQADALARFYRLAGDDVRFQAGTDENSIKNVQAADLAGVPVAERTADDGTGGNRFSFMFYGLPVHLEDPLELLTFAAAPLVSLERRAETLQAALRYLIFALLGSVLYLVGTALLYGVYGTLDLVLLEEIGALAEIADEHERAHLAE